MPDGLYLTVLAEIEQSVESGVCRDAPGVGVCGPECAELLSLYFFHGIRVGVIHPFRGVEKPVHAVAYARSEVYVLEEREVRQTDLEIVGHSVLELVQKSRLVELGSLEIHLVLYRGAVAERKLFVKLFLADPVFSFERVEPAHGKGEVRQGERIRTVYGVLAVQGIDGQVHLSVPVLRVRNGRRYLILKGFRHRCGVVPAVGRAGEIHGRAERCPWSRLRILRVAPSDTEIGHLREIGTPFFTGLVIGIREGEVSRTLVVDLVP